MLQLLLLLLLLSHIKYPAVLLGCVAQLIPANITDDFVMNKHNAHNVIHQGTNMT